MRLRRSVSVSTVDPSTPDSTRVVETWETASATCWHRSETASTAVADAAASRLLRVDVCYRVRSVVAWTHVVVASVGVWDAEGQFERGVRRLTGPGSHLRCAVGARARGAA